MRPIRVIPVALALLLEPAGAACGDGRAPDRPQLPLPIGSHVRDWRDQVVYEVLVDRFDDADEANDRGVVRGDLARYQGGDWAGITRRLDYLRGLGVTAIWISPPVDNNETDPFAGREDAYHGYWGRDFTRPNRHFGDEDDLARLVVGCHARGMLVIADVVMNHVGPLFFYDADRDGVLGAGEGEPPFAASPRDPIVWLDDPAAGLGPPVFWLDSERTILDDLPSYHRRGQTTEWGDPEQVVLGDFPTGLRDLDTENARVRRALVDTYAWWIERFDLDGLRIDTVPHVAHESWVALASSLRERLASTPKRRFLLLGEVFDGDDRRAASYTEPGSLDAVLWFGLKLGALDPILLDGRPTRVFSEMLARRDEAYGRTPQPGGAGLGPRDLLFAFADNHDVARILGEIDDERVLRLAMLMVFGLDAIPTVYYGTEQELAGGPSHDARRPLFERGFDPDAAMYRFIARLAELRGEHPALRYGDVVVRFDSDLDGHQSGPGAGMLAWERSSGTDRVLVAMNAHAFDPADATDPEGRVMTTGFPAATTLVDALAPREHARRFVVLPGGALPLRLAPREAVLLVPDTL